jgi:GT2 family glycosyltransferase
VTHKPRPEASRLAKGPWQSVRALGRRIAPPATLRGHIVALVAARLGPLADLARGARRFAVVPVQPAPLRASAAEADLIICVHNALPDVRACLAAVVRHTRPPYRLILVDDGSEAETAAWLSEFARAQGAELIRHPAALGYTRAANAGLRRSGAPLAVLLNSDTLPAPGWLDRLAACAEADARIGLAGPLSNTASWQSIPDLFAAGGDWAENPLPPGLAPAEMGYLVAAHAGRLYPRVTVLNGFCLLIKRAVLDSIGLFDEQTFPEGYGEENDFGLRARTAGWQLAVADDAYVFHAQSRSYSHERRRELSALAQQRLAAKHGLACLAESVERVRTDRVLAGIRARTRVMLEREELRAAGRARWEGRRVLCLLPVRGAGGGANVIVQEAQAARHMGVDFTLLNLEALRAEFAAGYPDLDLPVRYVDDPAQVASLAGRFDAVLATQNMSVEWMNWVGPGPVRAYYIQDYEPWFFPEGSADHARAVRSYAAWPDLTRVTKTEWTRATVRANAGVECAVIGPSVDTDLFRPRPRRDGDWPSRPLRVAAMIRPDAPRRQARLTLEVLRAAARQHGRRIEVVLFGCDPRDPGFRGLPHDFRWRSAGMLTRAQTAFLLNEVDIFADFSVFQAMGLTALEAMACGAAVIVPAVGGAETFARPERNCLAADTSTAAGAAAALERLITDIDLRRAVGRQAIEDAVHWFPERAAFNLLRELFAAQS